MRYFVFCKDQLIVSMPLESDLQNGSSQSSARKAESYLGTLVLTWQGFPEDDARDILKRAHRAHFRFKNEEYGVWSIDQAEEGYFKQFAHIKVRELIGMLDQESMALVIRAMAYANWSLVSNFCGACGSPLQEGEDDEHLAKVCSHCGRVFFPRMSPAVIVLIHKEDRILLAHNLSFPDGRYGLIAGFVELGETFEQTVHREVMEEAGIEICEPHYVRSQPWPFPDSLMVAFDADWKAGEPRPDGKEIGALGWFTLDELPNIPLRGSVARYLIDHAVEQNRKQKKT